ncbi:serine hydrolase domain-containing protein [Billgrantia montanilacus]|uniref:Class C beta-lactamase-related serine hydrolase n=1 Tax=Billgrantia montanilacus TaxID=2282305 RepID=A0A368TVQ3_9GAMM|nr:serine hydrolase [Halomonas montanilacus]RCV88426.1 class C beta-lactamase-related serine hydrolase [Halomonas montanilacus]
MPEAVIARHSARQEVRRSRLWTGTAVALWLTALASQGLASTPVLTAAESDPVKLGWMQGFPPPSERIIGHPDSDYFSFPKLRWTVCHFRELLPTRRVSRGLQAARPLSYALDPNIDAVTFTPLGGVEPVTWGAAFDANYTDGLLVLHEGRVVHERYAGCLDEAGVHGAMSVTKSVTGLLAEILVAEGSLDETALVAEILPELKDSAFGNATVQQVMEMTTGLDFSEDYADPEAEIWAYSAAASPLPKPEDYEGPRSYYEFLATVQPEGTHGEAFGYRTVNSDALGWIIARTAGSSVADLVSERLWQPMGGEQDAYFTVDSIGTPFAGGGLSAGLRDLARLGQLVLDGGELDGERLFPEAAVDRIRQGGDRDAFARAGYENLPGGSYRGMWWLLHNDHGAFTARGVHGQTIYVDPTARMVIVRFASHPVAGNTANDATSLPAYQALAEYLMQREPAE